MNGQERGRIESLVTPEPLDSQVLIAAVSDGANGAVSCFIGTVRNSSSAPDRAGSVLRLEYEAYTPMAEREMLAIAQEATETCGAASVIVHHRIGVLSVGEAAVVVAVGSPRRSQAFDACRYVIEELKKRVPIWKKEVFEDGAVWVDPHP